MTELVETGAAVLASGLLLWWTRRRRHQLAMKLQSEVEWSDNRRMFAGLFLRRLKWMEAFLWFCAIGGSLVFLFIVFGGE